MFFHSTRPGGCGAGDIWMTRRHNRRSQEWGPPINLGCVVNTAATEIAPAFFENPETGQVTLFYGSNRPGGFGRRLRRLCKRCRRRRLLRAGSAGAGVQQRRARHAHFHKERWPGGVHHIGPDGRTGPYRHLDVDAGHALRHVVDARRSAQSRQQRLRRWLSLAFTRRDDAVFLLNACPRLWAEGHLVHNQSQDLPRRTPLSQCSPVSGTGCLRTWPGQVTEVIARDSCC